jgi:hypothetical protein
MLISSSSIPAAVNGKRLPPGAAPPSGLNLPSYEPSRYPPSDQLAAGDDTGLILRDRGGHQLRRRSVKPRPPTVGARDVQDHGGQGDA